MLPATLSGAIGPDLVGGSKEADPEAAEPGFGGDESAGSLGGISIYASHNGFNL